MKGLQWDLMTIAARYQILKLWDCDDFGGRALIVDLDWVDLPMPLRQALRWMR